MALRGIGKARCEINESKQSVDKSGKERSTGRKKGCLFEGNSWYHRTKELTDDLTTKYSKKGGFKTPEEAEKSYWEYEERYREKQREFQVAFLKSKKLCLENIFSIGLNIFILCGLRQRQGCWDRIHCMN